MQKNSKVVEQMHFKAKMTTEKAAAISTLGINLAADSIQYNLAILLAAVGRKEFLRMMEKLMETVLKDYERVADDLEDGKK